MRAKVSDLTDRCVQTYTVTSFFDLVPLADQHPQGGYPDAMAEANHVWRVQRGEDNDS